MSHNVSYGLAPAASKWLAFCFPSLSGTSTSSRLKPTHFLFQHPSFPFYSVQVAPWWRQPAGGRTGILGHLRMSPGARLLGKGANSSRERCNIKSSPQDGQQTPSLEVEAPGWASHSWPCLFFPIIIIYLSPSPNKEPWKILWDKQVWVWNRGVCGGGPAHIQIWLLGDFKQCMIIH